MSRPVIQKIRVRCEKCGKEFADWISSKRQFCSRRCWYGKRRSLLGYQAPAWKDAKTDHNSGYLLVSRNGQLYLEHRWIMEQHIGRKLLPNEHIHHIDGNKKNNKLDNLALLTQEDHTRLHMIGNQR